jgi:hypothetical protein
MVHLGQVVELWLRQDTISSSWNSNCCFRFGGYLYPNSPPVSAATEEYDGSTWTTSPGSMNTARRNLAGAGTQTAALGFGGYDTALTAATEEYNGSTWTKSY